MTAPARAIGKGYFKRRGWKDLIFLACVATLAYPFRHDIFPLNDYQKWERRSQIEPGLGQISHVPGQDGMPPCFFAVPPTATREPLSSASVGDCIELVPDGRKLDLFEVCLGDFVHVRTDLWVNGAVPLAFTRVLVRQTDWDKRNGNFIPNVYNSFLSGNRSPYTYLNWLLPDRLRIHYNRISPGTGYADAIYEASYAAPPFDGSRVSWNGWGWDIALENGITYLSPEAYYATRAGQGSLAGIFDKQGREIRLVRNKNGDLTEVKSPSGGWIRFTYDGKGRMTEARASSSAFARYLYDSDDRLSNVQYSTAETITYRYGPLNTVTNVDDPAERVHLENKYDSHGALIRQTLNGRTYGFFYKTNNARRTGQMEITALGSKTTVRLQEVDHHLTYTVEQSAH